MNKSNKFCLDILNLKINRPKAVANLVMALSSYDQASNPVELSESTLYPRKYHSIYQSIQDLVKDSKSYEKVSKQIRKMCLKYFDIQGDVYDLQTDTTAIVKPHSPCLKDRMFVSIPNNMILGNKPLNIGYKYSFINLALNQPDYTKEELILKKPANSKWTSPVSINRIKVDSTVTQTTIAQLKNIFSDTDLPFWNASLVCNTLDSYYGNACYLSQAHHQDNLVNIVRLRSSIKIYPQSIKTDTGGAPQIYGSCHYLIEKTGMYSFNHKGSIREKHRDSVLDLECDEKLSFQSKTRKGNLLRIEVSRFNNMMISTKNGFNMKDKPFDLLYCRVFDVKTDNALFKPMWLAIAGEKRQSISTYQGYCKYSHRYDIEPFFRFGKQKLLLDKYQTSNVAYLDNWVLIVQMAAWLLWTASDEVTKNPKEWQKYLPEYKTDDAEEEQSATEDKKDVAKKPPESSTKDERLTIAQTRKGAETLFMTFDKQPFSVQKSNKGKGRKKGEKLEPKKKYKVVKKDKKTARKRAP